MNAPAMLRAAIELEGESQASLSREIGLTTKHVNKICQGKDPISVKVAILLEAALPSLSAEDLLCAQVRDQLQAARAEGTEQDPTRSEWQEPETGPGFTVIL